MTVKDFNEMQKPSSCDVVAKDTDLIFEISGYVFLVQRTKDFNNVIMFYSEKPTVSVIKALGAFREYCILHDVIYLRLEMSKERKLYKVFRYWQKHNNDTSDLNIVFSWDESLNNAAYVFYVRLI